MKEITIWTVKVYEKKEFYPLFVEWMEIIPFAMLLSE